MLKTLVVDDEPDNCALLEGILEEISACTSVYTGKAGYEKFVDAFASNQRYDVVLLDVAMPDMDGIALLEKIRNYEEKQGILLGHGTPVIMVTAHSRTFMKSFKGGCDDFVTKPVDGDKLIEKIQTMVANSKASAAKQ